MEEPKDLVEEILAEHGWSLVQRQAIDQQALLYAQALRAG